MNVANPDDLGPTAALAKFACTADYVSLPAAAIASTKRVILDTLGCAIGAAELPASKIIARTMGAWGGRGEATALDTGVRLPLDRVAFINAQLANALDAEETTLWSGHIAACAVMPALAAAELGGLTGREMVATVATAFEVAGRIGGSFAQIGMDGNGQMALPGVRGHSWVAYAATVATGRCLALSTDAMRSAFGLTAALAPLPSAGNWQRSGPPRTMMKYGMFGAFAQAGVTAAMLAAAGYTGEPAMLDGPHGLWRMLGSPDCDFTSMIDDLGQSWLIQQASLKPFPCCRFAHPALALIDQLRSDHRLAADQITRVIVEAPATVFGMKMDDPCIQTPVDAQFCLPYQVAMILLGVEPGPDWQDADRFSSEAVARVMGRTRIALHPESSEMVRMQLEGGGRPLRFPYRVTLESVHGNFTASAEDAPGDPWAGRALTDEELDRKFRAFTRSRLSPSRADAAIGALRRLEHERVTDIVELLSSDLERETD